MKVGERKETISERWERWGTLSNQPADRYHKLNPLWMSNCTCVYRLNSHTQVHSATRNPQFSQRKAAFLLYYFPPLSWNISSVDFARNWPTSSPSVSESITRLPSVQSLSRNSSWTFPSSKGSSANHSFSSNWLIFYFSLNFNSAQFRFGTLWKTRNPFHLGPRSWICCQYKTQEDLGEGPAWPSQRKFPPRISSHKLQLF